MPCGDAHLVNATLLDLAERQERLAALPVAEDDAEDDED